MCPGFVLLPNSVTVNFLHFLGRFFFYTLKRLKPTSLFFIPSSIWGSYFCSCSINMHLMKFTLFHLMHAKKTCILIKFMCVDSFRMEFELNWNEWSAMRFQNIEIFGQERSTYLREDNHQFKISCFIFYYRWWINHVIFQEKEMLIFAENLLTSVENFWINSCTNVLFYALMRKKQGKISLYSLKIKIAFQLN